MKHAIGRYLTRIVLAGVAVLGLVTASLAEEPRFVRIGTGGTAGTYYPIGGLIASIISNPPGSRPCDKGGSCGVPNLIAVVQSSNGSVDNVTRLGAGELELALSQADIAYWAFHGTGLFAEKGPITNLRAIASLFQETVHVVVRRESGIDRIADLGGRRVSLGEHGSGTLVNAQAVLDAYGIDVDDIEAQYLNAGAATLMMSAGKLDAFFFVAGPPVGAIEELARTTPIKLLPIDGAEADTLVAFYPFFTKTEIPSGVYHGVDGVNTIGIGAQLLVAAELDDDLVYGITRALWHENARKLLDRGHAKGRDIRLETALAGISVPLHPGAERYYREVGLIK